VPLWDIIDDHWDRHLYFPLHAIHAIGYFLNLTYFYDKTGFNEDGEVHRGLMTCIKRYFPNQKSKIVPLPNYKISACKIVCLY
jgi:hypothetical protein